MKRPARNRWRHGSHEAERRRLWWQIGLWLLGAYVLALAGFFFTLWLAASGIVEAR